MTNLPSMSALWRRLKSGVADPIRDWFVLITVSGILLIAIVAWNIWAFSTVANGGTLGASGTQSAQSSFDTTSLNAVRTTFQNRATEAAKYETGVYRYADPSQ